MLKLSDYYVTTQMIDLLRTKVKLLTPLYGQKILIVCTRVPSPVKRLTNCFFLPEIMHVTRPNFPKTNGEKNKYIWQKTNPPDQIVNGLTRTQ